MLDELKRKLNITWGESDEELEDSISSGKSFLESLTGTKPNFEKGLAKILLLEYARYYYNNASEYFEDNFKSEILRLQFLEATKEN